MGLQKIAFNFMVECSGKLAKSLLCSKPKNAVTKTIGLKYAPTLQKDVVQLSKNDYLANIRKLALNDKDTEILEDLLSYSEQLQSEFNSVVNRSDINMEGLRKLFTGGEVNDFGRKFYRNDILHYDERFKVALNRLKTMQPNDLVIIKNCHRQELEIFNSKNDLNDFILPDKYIKQLSNLLKEDNVSIQTKYSDSLKRYIIECSGKDETYFTYDRLTKSLEFFEENGNTKIKTIRCKNGNEKLIKVNPDNKKSGELLKETIYLKDKKGNLTQRIKYEKSDIDGVFNVIEKDLNTGKEIPLSEVIIDSAGKKIVRQNLVSPKGVKSHVHYEEMPNGNTEYSYKIVDKKGNTLLDQVHQRTVLNDSEFMYKINDKSYNVKFVGSDKIEILNQQTKQLDTIDIKALLSELSETEKTQIIDMLKKIPADELLTINKYEIDQLLLGSINSSSGLLHSGSIVTMPKEFVFLHELGHQKDSGISALCKKERELLKKIHKENKNMWDDIDNWQCDIDNSLDVLEIMKKLEKSIKKTQISSNQNLLKIYKKERAAYIKKFGSEDKRINYFIKKGSGLGCEGETVAEINALLSTPISEAILGLRSYLLTENFPETVAYASKLLF